MYTFSAEFSNEVTAIDIRVEIPRLIKDNSDENCTNARRIFRWFCKV